MDRQIKVAATLDDVHLCYTAFQPLPSVDNVHGLRFWTAHVIFSTEDVGTAAFVDEGKDRIYMRN